MRESASKPGSQPTDSAIQYEQHSLQLTAGSARLHHFSVPLSSAKIEYVDLSYCVPLVEAEHHSQLLINGGYWGYSGTRRVIEGLLVVNDQQLSARHAHGGVLEIRAGSARIVRGEVYQRLPGTSLALQCSPRLVQDGRLIPKLEAKRRAARTALCIGVDRGLLHVYLTEDRITLPELATFLLRQGCHEALNLDGGPSTSAHSRSGAGELSIGRGDQLPYGIGFSTQ